jgi:flagellar hook-length control protein FliK
MNSNFINIKQFIQKSDGFSASSAKPRGKARKAEGKDSNLFSMLFANSHPGTDFCHQKPGTNSSPSSRIGHFLSNRFDGWRLKDTFKQPLPISVPLSSQKSKYIPMTKNNADIKLQPEYKDAPIASKSHQVIAEKKSAHDSVASNIAKDNRQKPVSARDSGIEKVPLVRNAVPTSAVAAAKPLVYYDKKDIAPAIQFATSKAVMDKRSERNPVNDSRWMVFRNPDTEYSHYQAATLKQSSRKPASQMQGEWSSISNRAIKAKQGIALDGKDTFKQPLPISIPLSSPKSKYIPLTKNNLDTKLEPKNKDIPIASKSHQGIAEKKSVDDNMASNIAKDDHPKTASAKDSGIEKAPVVRNAEPASAMAAAKPLVYYDKKDIAPAVQLATGETVKDERGGSNLANDSRRIVFRNPDSEESHCQAATLKPSSRKPASQMQGEPSSISNRVIKAKQGITLDGVASALSNHSNTSTTSPASLSSTPTPRTSRWDNFLDFMDKVLHGARIIQRSEGFSELRVQMASESLGRVMIHVSVADKKVDVCFALDSHQAKQLLEDHRSELIHMLKDTGANTVNVDVSTSSPDKGYHNRETGETNDRSGNLPFSSNDDSLVLHNEALSAAGIEEIEGNHYQFDGYSTMVWVA